jgi:CRISPR-associated protein Cas2
MSGARTWVIGYDIASPRRLRRVARFLEKCAVRVQYSLFIGRFTPLAFETTWRGLAGLINPRADDVRAWPVPEQPWIWTYGTTLPEGVFLAAPAPAALWSALAAPDDEGLPDDAVCGEDARTI